MIKLISGLLILSVSLFSKERIEEFYKNPYLKVNQEKVIDYVNEQKDYRTNYQLLSTLQDVYIYTEYKTIESKVKELLTNENFKEEEIIKDKTTGKERVKKINTDGLKKKFNENKKNLSKNIKYVFVLIKDKEFEKADELYFNLIQGKHKQTNEFLLNKIKYMIYKSNLDDSTVELNKFLDKEIAKMKKVKQKKEISFVLGDLFSYGSLLNIEDKEKNQLYKEKAIKLYGDSSFRYNAILGLELKKKGYFDDSIDHLEELRKTMNEHIFNTALLDSYYKASRISLMNNNYIKAWNQSRKGLFMAGDVLTTRENRLTYIPIILELKKHLKISSQKYIEQLIDNGEDSYASKIKNETLKILSKNYSN